MTARSVVFRCDATAATGLGHLSRCIALAEAVTELGATTRFVGAFEAPGKKLLASASFSTSDMPATKDDLLVIDGYGFDAAFVARAAETSSVVLIDDFAALSAYPANITLLNFTIAASTLPYPAPPKKLLGPGFFLARRSLREVKKKARTLSPRSATVLVSIGGVDRHGLSRLVVETLLAIEPAVRVLVAAGQPSAALDEAKTLLGARGEVTIGAPSLAPLFAQADAVISGGGLTKYEAAYLGIPTAVISQTEEQADETRAFVGAGLAIDLGLGTSASVASLRADIKRTLFDAELRARLRASCAKTFADDPTLAAARALLEARS